MVKTIPIWKIGKATIYPHLEFDKLYSYEELRTIVDDMKSFYQDAINMIVYEPNKGCGEVNGEWNVCFGVLDGKGQTFMYMLRRDKHIGKSYACPFQNTDYVYDIKHSVLDGNSIRYPEEFGMIEKYLIEKLSGKHITAFPTEKEKSPKKRAPSGFGHKSVFNYDPDNGDLSPIAVKIPHSGWSPKLG
jgi:hypothetical protein